MSMFQVYLQAKQDYPNAAHISVRNEEMSYIVRVYESYTHDDLELIAKYRVEM